MKTFRAPLIRLELPHKRIYFDILFFSACFLLPSPFDKRPADGRPRPADYNRKNIFTALQRAGEARALSD